MVGLRYTVVFNLLFSLSIITSRKAILWSFSISMVKLMLGCSEFMCCKKAFNFSSMWPTYKCIIYVTLPHLRNASILLVDSLPSPSAVVSKSPINICWQLLVREGS